MQFEEKSLRKFNVGANMVPKYVRRLGGVIGRGVHGARPHPVKLPTCERKRLKEFSVFKNKKK